MSHGPPAWTRRWIVVIPLVAVAAALTELILLVGIARALLLLADADASGAELPLLPKDLSITGSLAVAVTLTVLPALKVAPLAGEVRLNTGGWLVPVPSQAPRLV